MNSVSIQIQRAINDAISNQLLPQIQNAFKAGSGQATQKGWNVPAERPEYDTEDCRDDRTKCNSKTELMHDFLNYDSTGQAYDMVTGDNESPLFVPEFLTGRMPSKTHLNQSHDDLNALLDTTIPAQEKTAPAAEVDLVNRLADVLTSMQNRSTAEQLVVCPVNSNTMPFDGNSEKFELFEDLFHTVIKMQPEMSEPMKINHFHSLLRKGALQTFRNIGTTNRQSLEDILVVKPKSQAVKHKWHGLVIDPNTMKLPDFLEEHNQGAEKTFGDHAQQMSHSLLYAKLPPKWKRSVNMARLENGSYDEIVANLERELQLNALAESDDLPMATMTFFTSPNGLSSNITCNH